MRFFSSGNSTRPRQNQSKKYALPLTPQVVQTEKSLSQPVLNAVFQDCTVRVHAGWSRNKRHDSLLKTAPSAAAGCCWYSEAHGGARIFVRVISRAWCVHVTGPARAT